jgi:hypothetical protein
VVIVDPRTSAVETRRIGEGNLDVFSGAVSADEQRVYLSFHGNESGVRAYDISGSTLTSLFHLRTHGNFALMGDRILATTGGPSIEEFDRKGQRIRVIDTGLTGNHLMEFSVDDKQVLYAAGSCMYSGGLTRVELSPGTTPRILSPSGNWNGRFPQPQWEVCGERISVASSGTWLALAALRNGVSPSSARPGTILIVDARTGAILRSLATSSEVVDVLALN